MSLCLRVFVPQPIEISFTIVWLANFFIRAHTQRDTHAEIAQNRENFRWARDESEMKINMAEFYSSGNTATYNSQAKVSFKAFEIAPVIEKVVTTSTDRPKTVVGTLISFDFFSINSWHF